MKYRFKPTQQFWESFYGLSSPQKDSTRKAWQIFKEDPFQTLDQTGVGQLMQGAVQKGRKVKKDLKCGICGEHGGDPASVKFCHRTGLDYVSCSPYRVPIARLAAAQAVIEGKSKSGSAYTQK